MAHRMGDSQGVIGPVVFVGSWQELSEQGDRHPGSPALVDPGFGEVGDPQAAPSPWASEYSWYSTPLIHYARTWPGAPTAETAHPYTAFLRAGVDDDLDTMDATILRSIDVGQVHRLLEDLEHFAHPLTYRIFHHAVNLAIGPVSVPAAAESVGLQERTMQRHCFDLAIPPPNAIVALARIFTVERLAEWSRQSPGAVAVSLGFSAKPNYRRLVRRHFGVPPSVVRRRGGSKYVAEVIVQSLAVRG